MALALAWIKSVQFAAGRVSHHRCKTRSCYTESFMQKGLSMVTCSTSTNFAGRSEAQDQVVETTLNNILAKLEAQNATQVRVLMLNEQGLCIRMHRRQTLLRL